MLALKNISIQFGGIKALSDVSFEVENNSLFSIIYFLRFPKTFRPVKIEINLDIFNNKPIIVFKFFGV